MKLFDLIRKGAPDNRSLGKGIYMNPRRVAYVVVRTYSHGPEFALDIVDIAGGKMTLDALGVVDVSTVVEQCTEAGWVEVDMRTDDGKGGCEYLINLAMLVSCEEGERHTRDHGFLYVRFAGHTLKIDFNVDDKNTSIVNALVAISLAGGRHDIATVLASIQA